MILEFSKENPKTIRQMFEILFDENKNISERIEKFKNIADELQETHNHNNSSKWKSHFQFVLPSLSIYSSILFSSLIFSSCKSKYDINKNKGISPPEFCVLRTIFTQVYELLCYATTFSKADFDFSIILIASASLISFSSFSFSFFLTS